MRKRLLTSLLLSISLALMAQTTIPVGASQIYKKIGDAYSTGIPATISGAYIIELQSDYDPSGETYPITLGSKTGASATNTITIKPANGVSKTIDIPITPITSISTSAASNTTTKFYTTSTGFSSTYKIGGYGIGNSNISAITDVTDGVVTLQHAFAWNASFNGANSTMIACPSSGTILKFTTAAGADAKTFIISSITSGITQGMIVGGNAVASGTTVSSVTVGTPASKTTIVLSQNVNTSIQATPTLYFTDASTGVYIKPIGFQLPVSGTAGLSLNMAVTGTNIGTGSTVNKIASSSNDVYTTASGTFSASTSLIFTPVTSSTIVLNGSNWITIDGGAKSNMIISNAFTSANTILLQGGASNNTIKNCTVKGAGSSASYANIWIGATTQTAACNNNTITLCDICDGAAATKPSQGVYFAGAASYQNTGNSVIYNNLYNFAATGLSNSIACIRTGDANTNTTTVSNNKIYWTSDIDYAGNYNFQYGIIVRGGSNTVSNNIIGYKASDGTGNFKISGTQQCRFYGIKVEGGTSYANRTVVSNNKVANVTLEVANNNSPDPDAIITGIFTYNTASTYVDINNNTIDSLRVYNNTNPNLPGPNNTPTGVRVGAVGIYSLAPYSYITTNTVKNIESHRGNTIVSSAVNCSARGISVYETAASTATISGNTVYNIIAGETGNTASAINAAGIYAGATNVDKIEKNLIYNIRAQNSTQTAVTYGIYSNYSSSTSTTPTYVKNNIIRLGTNLTTGNIIHGIYQKESATGSGFKFNVYNNSVFIGGSVTSGASGFSSAFTRAVSAIDKQAELKNNIFVNVRTGDAGKHFVDSLANATDYSSSYLVSNNNLYQIATGTNNKLGIVGTTEIADFTTWKSTCTGFDGSSINANPQFIDPTNATTPDLRINTNSAAVAAKGADLHTVVTDDYYGTSRSAISTPALGAYEFTYTSAATDYFKSATSGNWGTTSIWQTSPDNTNWTTATSVPTASAASVTILNGHEVTIATNATAPVTTVNGGGKLTLNDTYSLTVSSLALQSDATNGNGTFVDKNTSPQSITASVQQYMPQGRNWYLSSPITNGNTSNLIGAGIASSVLYYDELNSNFTSFNGTLTSGKGYIAVSSSGTGNNNIIFNGTLNSGTVNIPLSRQGITKAGFNLVANPYASYLDVMTPICANSNLVQTLWYRTRSTGVTPTYFFETVNTTSGVGTNAAGTGTVSGYVPPMQAFWVRTNTDNQTLTFTNALRYHANPTIGQTTITTTPMKVHSQVAQQLIRLRVSNETNSDETIIYFNPNAADGYDAYDSPKMSNNNSAIPEIFTTVVGGNDQLAINGMNGVKYDAEIPVGFTAGQLSNFTISNAEMTNFGTETHVILKDKLLNNETELAEGTTYSFSSQTTSSTLDRFSIIFRSSGTTTGTNKDKKSNTEVFVNADNHIIISAPVETKIAIHNSLGQKQYDAKLSTSRLEITDKFKTGVYLISLTLNGKSETFKAIIH